MTYNISQMSLLSKLLIAPKALRQMGARPLFLYGGYQFKLRSGILRLQTPTGGRKQATGSLEIKKIVQPASKEEIKKALGGQEAKLFNEADEILNGQVRLFGGKPRLLDFALPRPLKHWTVYTKGLAGGADIKPVWEVGRFGWATVLARAYWLSEDDRYAEGLWQLTEKFLAVNPVNVGPQWSSAQEVALRLIALAFCYSLVADATASTRQRKEMLAASLAALAERIPPTLDYARAQSNNHLLSEATGLYTAAALLPEHPKAAKWRQLGRKTFFDGLDGQIHKDGSYAQHSANYQRLMLQLGVWCTLVANLLGERVPKKIVSKLAVSANWLLHLLDEASGELPNLGPNDGSYSFPFTALPLEDYRPVLQTAGLAFENQNCLERGPWDEMALWLGMRPEPRAAKHKPLTQPIRIEGKDSWAYFRVAEFRERPGHADQLHLDLWWRGLNIAQDAGSYLYTAAAPWDNALASTQVHNSVMLADNEQMMRAGRFLWLDWAQGKILSTESAQDGRLIAAEAEHDGYRKLGATHRREVRAENSGRWIVSDHIISMGNQPKAIRARLHWLLPDWDWQFENDELHIRSPHGVVELLVQTSVGDQAEFQLVRAGELVHGSGPADPILGWRSPTYGVKLPVLSFNVDVNGPLPITITSTWTLPK
jgi:hypothetical protein